MIKVLSILCGLTAPLRRFFRREEGGGAIELVILLPVMMSIFMASSEAGLYMTRQIIIERAVDLTMRDLRLGTFPNPTHDAIKTAICDNAKSVPHCIEGIRVELRPVSTTTWNLPTTAPTCIDRDEAVQPANTFSPGAENELMLVRVCVIQDAMFPGAGIGAGVARDSQGGYGIITIAAFVNEPS